MAISILTIFKTKKEILPYKKLDSREFIMNPGTEAFTTYGMF